MYAQHMTIDDLLDRIEQQPGDRTVVVDSWQPIVDVQEIDGSAVVLMTGDAAAIQACVEYVTARRDAGDPVATAIMTTYAAQLDAE